jgi:hypothetical protein
MWLDYIGKLNDRALNRQQSSGVTTWAVAGVIVILGAKVLANLPNVTKGLYAVAICLTSVAGIVNILTLVGIFLLVLMIKGAEPGEPRLQSRLERATMPLVSTAILTVSAFFGAVNIGAALYAPNILSHWPFWALAAFFLFNAIAYPTSRIKCYIRRAKHSGELPELSTPLLWYSVKDRKRILNAVLVSCFLGLCVALVPVAQSVPNITTAVHVEALMLALYLAGAIFLSVFLCFRLVATPRDLFLAQLERRIIVEGIGPEAIRSEFMRELVGEHLREWIARAEGELDRHHRAFEASACDAEKKLAQLTNIDNCTPPELDGRRKDICKELFEILKEYHEYQKRLIRQFQHLTDQEASGAFPDIFRQILDDWKYKLESIKPRYMAVCKVCHGVLSAHTDSDQCAPPFQTPWSDS